MIRKAKKNDIPAVLRCYQQAKNFMHSNGNKEQWPGDYPGHRDAEADLEAGSLYVMEENGRIYAAFTFIIGDEPTYRVIENGSWLSQEPYGTIHRVASDGTGRGVFRDCLQFCQAQIGHLRIDTHADNDKMLALIQAAGFCERGIIRVENGTPRQAFEYIAKNL